ncbi:ras association domain-containing protein 2 [Pipra filicauda]|uniref:Ras association domain-containing protein 2 n=1 Tax=Pipra filicauda TaxID=649802 RepID=A0A6J2HZ62_9PASS|nr:ras association domain-containing protein 2 [Pipra filicauda]XP_027592464.1 ras association domain-containing protein 2 [Pipra filicauda]XP_027592465.1 ras association domain-containing protein 2 [Pipra filicauda]XP_027592466.1 ras association domain-containing protein 2 [Pipra filicauda]XP_039240563.1 ras association domain-containing protein 2 [Pipra filicauda]
MDFGGGEDLVPCGKDKFISKNELLLHLKTYNIYYEGQNLQLRHREEEGELIVEGLLNISWGLRRPIRLQMQDDNQRIRPPPSSSSWHSGCNLGAHGSVLKPSTLPDIQVTDAEATPNTEAPGNGTAPRPAAEEAPQLMRTRSDVGVRPRGSARTAGEQRRIRRHRFSINGHFYNHKTSVFTPAYGSVTNVRINSTMTTPQVLKLLLNKFKIENSAEEFALYIVHTSGEKQKLRGSDYPLLARVLQGPCEQVSKVFLMEKDQVEEVTYDVAQYIKFEMPILRSFIQKLEEEEDREVKKLMQKYTILRVMIKQRLEEISEGPTAM